MQEGECFLRLLMHLDRTAYRYGTPTAGGTNASIPPRAFPPSSVSVSLLLFSLCLPFPLFFCRLAPLHTVVCRWSGGAPSHLWRQDFFEKLLDYMCSGPVVAMVWEGTNVIAGGRKVIPGRFCRGDRPRPRLPLPTYPRAQ